MGFFAVDCQAVRVALEPPIKALSKPVARQLPGASHVKLPSKDRCLQGGIGVGGLMGKWNRGNRPERFMRREICPSERVSERVSEREGFQRFGQRFSGVFRGFRGFQRSKKETDSQSARIFHLRVPGAGRSSVLPNRACPLKLPTSALYQLRLASLARIHCAGLRLHNVQ